MERRAFKLVELEVAEVFPGQHQAWVVLFSATGNGKVWTVRDDWPPTRILTSIDEARHLGHFLYQIVDVQFETDVKLTLAEP